MGKCSARGMWRPALALRSVVFLGALGGIGPGRRWGLWSRSFLAVFCWIRRYGWCRPRQESIWRLAFHCSRESSIQTCCSYGWYRALTREICSFASSGNYSDAQATLSKAATPSSSSTCQSPAGSGRSLIQFAPFTFAVILSSPLQDCPHFSKASG